MHLTIVGLGVVGCSVGLALKAVAPDLPITGHDRDAERAKTAKTRGAVDRTHWNLLSACQDADLILLDLPLSELLTTLPILGREAKEGAVLVDTCPVKRPVLEIARTLPPRVAFVGGRIVSQSLGEAATPAASLLHEATFYLTPSDGASAQALEMASNLAEAVGAHPRYSDAQEHDGIAAGMAQAPLLCALGLLDILTTAPGARERRAACGVEFAALLALLQGSAQTIECLQANADDLLPWLDAALTQWARLRQLLADDPDALGEELTRVRETAAAWQLGPEREERPAAKDALPGWRQMLLGGLGKGS